MHLPGCAEKMRRRWHGRAGGSLGAADSSLAPTAAPAWPPSSLAERGRSIFEGVLRNYPKRLDLWSVYLDQEVALGDQQRVR